MLMSRHVAQILAELPAPGRLLAFVDDGGTPGKQIPNLAKDFQVLCAVVLPAEAYLEVKAEIRSRDYLSRRGLEEFHSTNIVNPGRSGWSRIPSGERIEVLQLLYKLVSRHATTILYGYISGEQWEGEMRVQLPPRLQEVTTREALEHVFFNGLIKHLRGLSTDFGVVMDAKMAMKNSIAVHECVDPTGLYEGGLIEVDSRIELGVQLADLAAYTFNRLYHIDHREKRKDPSRFDGPVAAGFRLLSPLMKDVLALDDDK